MARFRLALALTAALCLLPLPVAAATPAERPQATPAADAPRPFALALGRQADFVAQTNFVQCVGASMQMMINIIRPGRDRSSATQLRLQNLARTYSGPRPVGRERKGASVRGWAAGLTLMGAGPYKLVGEASLQGALKAAARAIRETGKPVGLLMWRGRHAWVMSGFQATADPAVTDDFRVTGVNVLDPLYPFGSAVWGRSPRAGELLTPAELGRQFKPRRTSSLSVQWIGRDLRDLSGKYVLVLPYAPRPYGEWAARIR